jgi:ribosome-binding protein aMBF1 (putative translation factor)
VGLMLHECQYCNQPVSKTGQLRKVKIGKQQLRLCKDCRRKLLEERKAKLNYGRSV